MFASRRRFSRSKGRSLDEALPITARAGLVPESEFYDKDSRALSFATQDGQMRIIRVRAFNPATERTISFRKTSEPRLENFPLRLTSRQSPSRYQVEAR